MTTGGEWSGPVGDVWATEWERTDRSFAGLAPALDAAILAAAPAGSGRAIDLGCGAGATSIAIAAARPDLDILGLDISAELVAVARERGRSLVNLRFATADLAAGAAAATGADLLFSRHGVMFFADPAAVFTRLRAAAPGAALVFSCFRAPSFNLWAGELVAAITGAPPAGPDGYTPGPFAFADSAWTAAMLTEAGWRVEAPQPVDYSYIAGEGADPVAAAAAFFRRIGPVSAALKAAPENARPAMLERLTAALEARRDGDHVTFPAAAWVWSVRA